MDEVVGNEVSSMHAHASVLKKGHYWVRVLLDVPIAVGKEFVEMAMFPASAEDRRLREMQVAFFWPKRERSNKGESARAKVYQF